MRFRTRAKTGCPIGAGITRPGLLAEQVCEAGLVPMLCAYRSRPGGKRCNEPSRGKVRDLGAAFVDDVLRVLGEWAACLPD